MTNKYKLYEIRGYKKAEREITSAINKLKKVLKKNSQFGADDTATLDIITNYIWGVYI